MRPTKKFFSSTNGARSPVRTSSTPMSVRPTVPVSLTPASSGTSRPSSSPIVPAEERVHVGARRGNAARRLGSRAGEAEDAGPFEEERPLLGKQQREARQVDLPRVHFGLAEVGVERRRQLQARRDVVEDVEAGFCAEARRPRRRCAASVPARNGRTSRPMPCVSPSRFVICPASDTCRNCVSRRAADQRPSSSLRVDGARDVEAPDVLAGGKAQALERNGELGDPSLSGAPACGRPRWHPTRCSAAPLANARPSTSAPAALVAK